VLDATTVIDRAVHQAKGLADTLSECPCPIGGGQLGSVTPKQSHTDLRLEGAHALADGRRRDPQFRGGARKIPQPHTGGKYAQRFQGRQSFRHASFEAELQMKVKNYRYATERRRPTM
jgi:hypothetical protein